MSYPEARSMPLQPSASYEYNKSTPPPPPPKPSHTSSGPGTPVRGPPLPPPPTAQGTSGSYETNHGLSTYPSQDAMPQLAGPEPGWLPVLLYDKTTRDLHMLLENSELQTALLTNPKTSHPSLQASQSPLQQLLESNISLATSLQQLETRLASQRSATQSRLLSLKALEQQHRTRIAETEDTLRNFSPMALYQHLNSSVQEQDALVKGIEESFLEESGTASEREIADFIRRLRDAKKTAYLRAERKERWDEGRVGGWR